MKRSPFIVLGIVAFAVLLFAAAFFCANCFCFRVPRSPQVIWHG